MKVWVVTERCDSPYSEDNDEQPIAAFNNSHAAYACERRQSTDRARYTYSMVLFKSFNEYDGE